MLTAVLDAAAAVPPFTSGKGIMRHNSDPYFAIVSVIIIVASLGVSAVLYAG